jgi:hypothetical protein
MAFFLPRAEKENLLFTKIFQEDFLWALNKDFYV